MKIGSPFNQARWIWPKPVEYLDISYPPLYNSYAQFRHDFVMNSVPRRAPFFITADQSYTLYVNGVYVCRGPARGYQISWPYDEVDLSNFLRKGRNWMSIWGHNPGISTFSYRHENVAGVLCEGQWGKTSIYSGLHWLMRCSPCHKLDTEKLSQQLGFQEHIDARADDMAWIYSSKVPKNWPEPKPGYCWKLGVMPWYSFEPRGIPNLTRDVVGYEKVCYRASGKCGEGFAEWKNPVTGFYNENKTLKWQNSIVSRNSRKRSQ